MVFQFFASSIFCSLSSGRRIFSNSRCCARKNNIVKGYVKHATSRVSQYVDEEQATIRSWSTHISHIALPCSRLFSLGANFPKWCILSFTKNFPHLEIHDPNTEELTWATFSTELVCINAVEDTNSIKISVAVVRIQ